MTLYSYDLLLFAASFFFRLFFFSNSFMPLPHPGEALQDVTGTAGSPGTGQDTGCFYCLALDFRLTYIALTATLPVLLFSPKG